jgi:hypothetical protein
VYLSGKSTSNPYDWLNHAQHPSLVDAFATAVKDNTGEMLELFAGIELTLDAHNDIRMSQKINQCWFDDTKNELDNQSPFSTWVWRYVATPSGMFRMLPASPWRHGYDPTTRGWYLNTANNFDFTTGKFKYTFSTPYVDGGGAGEVITLSKGIRGKSVEISERDLEAVVALDMTLHGFQDLLFDRVPVCSDVAILTCILVNDNGFVVYHNDFVSSTTGSGVTKEHVFIAEKHSGVAAALVEERVLVPAECVDFDESVIKTSYSVNRVNVAIGKKHVLDCGSFVMTEVSGTNLFFIAVDGNGCSFADRHPCVPCNRENCEADAVGADGALLCQPCSCGLVFNSCNGTFGGGGVGGDGQMPVCPVAPSTQFSDMAVCDPTEPGWADTVFDGVSPALLRLAMAFGGVIACGVCTIVTKACRGKTGGAKVAVGGGTTAAVGQTNGAGQGGQQEDSAQAKMQASLDRQFQQQQQQMQMQMQNNMHMQQPVQGIVMQQQQPQQGMMMMQQPMQGGIQVQQPWQQGTMMQQPMQGMPMQQQLPPVINHSQMQGATMMAQPQAVMTGNPVLVGVGGMNAPSTMVVNASPIV